MYQSTHSKMCACYYYMECTNAKHMPVHKVPKQRLMNSNHSMTTLWDCCLSEMSKNITTSVKNSPKMKVPWAIRYGQLMTFFHEHGHCNVQTGDEPLWSQFLTDYLECSVTHNANTKITYRSQQSEGDTLGRHVWYVHWEYLKYKHNEVSRLKHSQVEELEDLGFQYLEDGKGEETITETKDKKYTEDNDHNSNSGDTNEQIRVTVTERLFSEDDFSIDPDDYWCQGKVIVQAGDILQYKLYSLPNHPSYIRRTAKVLEVLPRRKCQLSCPMGTGWILSGTSFARWMWQRKKQPICGWMLAQVTSKVSWSW